MADRKYFTTTQAAKLLSVSPDTVLKWVKAGKIDSYRTPGGHCRIPADAINGLLPVRSEGASVSYAEEENARFRYCWEYNAGTCDQKGDCAECIVYRSRAKRCYELRSLPAEFGYLRLYCDSSCDDCDYYHLVKGQGPSVLVVTRSRTQIEKLKEQGEAAGFEVRFAQSEYESSSIVESFRPDYIVIDSSLGEDRCREFSEHISRDPRIPFARVIMVADTDELPAEPDATAFAIIRSPFTADDLEGLIRQAGDTAQGGRPGATAGSGH